MNTIQSVHEYIEIERNQLLNHPLYLKINTLKDLQTFTSYHVFAVWDFMSLLKALQRNLTCTSIPWFATTSPNTRYLINEIVLAEESDVAFDGSRLSHFEMYIDAMKTLGADTQDIQLLIKDLKSGNSIKEAISKMNVDERVKAFLRFSFSTIENGKNHEIAAAFTFGREDLIPDMFSSILKEFQARFKESDLSKLVYYFDRHIELDGDEHGPLAMSMILELAGDDTEKWDEIKSVSKEALQRRIELWDAINDSI